MKLEWRNTEHGQLVLHTDEQPTSVTIEFNPNETGDNQEPFGLRCGHRTKMFATLQDAKTLGITWWSEMRELGMI